MFLQYLLASFLYLLAYTRPANASALTTAIGANERLCFFADVDKAGEKIGVRVYNSTPLAMHSFVHSSSTLQSVYSSLCDHLPYLNSHLRSNPAVHSI